MGEVKEINIKNRTIDIKKSNYFFDDIIDIRNLHQNLLKIGKKLHRDIDIYCIG